MPDVIAPAAPAPPNPPTPPATPAAPATPPAAPDLTAPRQPAILNPEDDTDLQLQHLIAKRKDKPKEPPKGQEPPAATPTGDKKPAKAPFGKVIADALKFRKDKEPAAPAELPATPAPAAAATPPTEPEPPKKSIVTKKKVEPPTDRTAVIAGEAAAAAATKATQAALKTLESARPAARPDAFDPSKLSEVDRREYEVAQFLAKTDPRFKDAPNQIISQLGKTEKYASDWERANPGKVFDANDEEHNDFYEALAKPWTESQFEDAKIEMRVEEQLKKLSAADDKRLRSIESNAARSELSPVSEKAFYESAAALAKSVGDDIHNAIIKDGFDKFADKDPITADALALSLHELKPLIETIVMVDDPKGRIPLDLENPGHQQWLAFTAEKEAQFVGATDGKGRTFATRAEYRDMTPAQRTRHFYLTADDLLSELVSDASKILKEKIEKERERQKKIALAYGFTPGPASTPPSNNGNGDHKQQPPAEPTKPASPSAGSGAKVGDTDIAASQRAGGLLEKTSNILFRRS